MMNLRDVLRIAAIGAVLLAGSCASPTDELSKADPMINHPITVEPRFASLKLSFSAPEAGLLPDDAARFDAFVADYLSRGSGSISVSAPQGADSTAALTYFGARLFNMGVARARILKQLEASGGKHLVFVRYGLSHNLGEEWVYNGADIDRQRVIFAHDLGTEQNRTLLSYYPNRTALLLTLDSKSGWEHIEPYPVTLSK